MLGLDRCRQLAQAYLAGHAGGGGAPLPVILRQAEVSARALFAYGDPGGAPRPGRLPIAVDRLTGAVDLAEPDLVARLWPDLIPADGPLG